MEIVNKSREGEEEEEEESWLVGLRIWGDSGEEETEIERLRLRYRAEGSKVCVVWCKVRQREKLSEGEEVRLEVMVLSLLTLPFY